MGRWQFMAGKLETPHVVSYKKTAGVEVTRLKLIFKGIKLETRYLVSYMKSPPGSFFSLRLRAFAPLR
jgi:hypothetical protein